MSRALATRRSSPQTTRSWGRMETPITILAGYDGFTKAFFANVVHCKSTSHGYEERALASSVLSTGHQKVTLQSEHESSTVDVKHKARHAHPNRNRPQRMSRRRQQLKWIE